MARCLPRRPPTLPHAQHLRGAGDPSPSPSARPPTARAPIHRSPDHVGVLEGLQVPQHRHLADGGERHALLASLHSHALQRHETASVLQVPGLEHLPVGALPDLRHALILLVGTAQAVLLHAARRGAAGAGGGRARLAGGRRLPPPGLPGWLPRAPEFGLAFSLTPRRLPRSGARTLAAAGAGWSDLPAGGRKPGAAAAKLRLLSRRGASRSLLFPPRSAVLCRHRGDYIVSVSARARLSPRSFHLKEETGGQEKSVIRHPRRLLRGSYRDPSSSFTQPPSLPSASSCPLPGRLILPGSSEKNEVTFLSLQSWSRLRAERLQGPLWDERRARDAVEREGACQAAQSVPGARGRGGAGHVNVTA